MGEDLCNHTLREWNPYWEVDLGSMNIISEVKVWNREDSPDDKAYPRDFFTGRLLPCWILVSQVPFPSAAGKEGYAPQLATVRKMSPMMSTQLCGAVLCRAANSPVRLEGSMRVCGDKRRYYKPARLLSFPLPVGTLARYVRYGTPPCCRRVWASSSRFVL